MAREPRWSMPNCSSHLQARLLQVDLALDAAQDVAGDLAPVAELDERVALGGIDLVHHPLVAQRALLDAAVAVAIVVVQLARSDLEAPHAELVQAADALDR